MMEGELGWRGEGEIPNLSSLFHQPGIDTAFQQVFRNDLARSGSKNPNDVPKEHLGKDLIL